MAKSYIIRVVEEKGHKLFRYRSRGGEETFFETLPAYTQFAGGTLSIARDGKTIIGMSRIEIKEDHGLAVAFTGLSDVFNEKSLTSLDPSKLKSGDIVRLRLNESLHEKDLGGFLKTRYLVKESITGNIVKFKTPYDDQVGIEGNLAPLSEQIIPRILNFE